MFDFANDFMRPGLCAEMNKFMNKNEIRRLNTIHKKADSFTVIVDGAASACLQEHRLEKFYKDVLERIEKDWSID